MQLVDDIIKSLTGTGDQREPIADVLRRCLVLAYMLKNDALKGWLEKELNGYGEGDQLPPYRQITASARGHVIDRLGRQLKNQPLPASLIEPEHRAWASEMPLMQPIASYDQIDKSSDAAFQWPQDLVAMYQSSFYPEMTLTRAWIHIPASVLHGLVDKVKTKLLTFALEIRAELPDCDDLPPEPVAPATIERIVNYTIFGGSNVFGDVATFTPHIVNVGDLASLRTALAARGVSPEDLEQLESDLKADQAEAGEASAKSIGRRTWDWAKRVGPSLGGKLAEEGIKQIIVHYLGA